MNDSDSDSDSSIGDLLDGATDELSNAVKHATRAQWQTFRVKFEEFFLAMKATEGAFDEFEVEPTCVDDILVNAKSPPPYPWICRFLAHAASRAEGTIGETTSVESVRQTFLAMRSYLKHHARVLISAEDSRSAITYIRETLAIKLCK